MATVVTMPKLGLTMTEGTVSQWLKAEGDQVSEGENLFVVSTDKITYEVQAECDGFLLKIYVPENESVAVGADVAVIGAQGESAGAPSSEKPQEKKEEAASPSPEKASASAPVMRKEGSVVRATPKARKTSRDNSLDIASIPGSGPEGRVLNKDVIAYMEMTPAEKLKVSPTAARIATDMGVDLTSVDADGRIMKNDILRSIAPAAQKAEDEIVPMTPMRRIIGERMLESSQTVPSVTFNMSFDCSAMMEFRKTVKEPAKEAGAKVSYNDIIMLACAKVLQEQPMCNCSTDVENQCYILHRDVNIGLAVAVDNGLLVPNVKGTQNMTLQEIAAATDDLVQKTRENRLLPEDMAGGTFTISNLGMFGVDSFTPIVNPPESCILAVNAIVDKPVVVDGEIVVRPMSVLSLTADHRAVDGADGARFLARLKELLESPLLLLL